MARKTNAQFAALKAHKAYVAAPKAYFHGKTYDCSLTFKCHGGKFDYDDKVWVVTADKAEEITAALTASGYIVTRDGSHYTVSEPAPAAVHRLTGDTYPHRDALKANGCRWSNAQSCWTAPDAETAAAMQALINGEMTTTPAEVDSVELAMLRANWTRGAEIREKLRDWCRDNLSHWTTEDDLADLTAADLAAAGLLEHEAAHLLNQITSAASLTFRQLDNLLS